MSIEITSGFDSGSIEVVRATSPEDIELRIRPDVKGDGSFSEFAQWFHFRVSGGAGQALRVRISNASQTTYPDGWRNYAAVASVDRDEWQRAQTSYDGTALTIDLPAASGPIYVAYFEPYSWERHLDLVSSLASQGAQVRRLGSTLQGRDLDCIDVGQGTRQIWMIARQHPGESMAEWFIEGLLSRLLDADDPVARELRRIASFHIVPNVNPDGSVLGNLRTNAAGANLNREWMTPTAERSPEVLAVKNAILAGDCAAFFDIHGDENLPYVFVAGGEMLPNFGDQQRAEQAAFIADFKFASPDFQDAHGYSASKYKEDVLKLASKFIGHHYGCLSLTLEMPFKDNANAPDELWGWSSTRSQHLGAAMLEPIYRHLVRSTGA